MLAQWKTNFLYNPAEVVKENVELNGFPKHDAYRQLREMAKRGVESLVESGLITQDDTVIDVGAHYGSAAKYIKKKGIDVVALEPFFEELSLLERVMDAKKEKGNSLKESKKKELDGIVKMTAEGYVQNNPGKRFSVVHVSNFYSYTDEHSMTALADLTKDGGKALIGVCCVDPQDISDTAHNIQPNLEKYFEQVRFIPADEISKSEFETHFSVGGNLGYYECKVPKRPLQRLEDECTVM